MSDVQVNVSRTYLDEMYQLEIGGVVLFYNTKHDELYYMTGDIVYIQIIDDLRLVPEDELFQLELVHNYPVSVYIIKALHLRCSNSNLEDLLLRKKFTLKY